MFIHFGEKDCINTWHDIYRRRGEYSCMHYTIKGCRSLGTVHAQFIYATERDVTYMQTANRQSIIKKTTSYVYTTIFGIMHIYNTWSRKSCTHWRVRVYLRETQHEMLNLAYTRKGIFFMQPVNRQTNYKYEGMAPSFTNQKAEIIKEFWSRITCKKDTKHLFQREMINQTRTLHLSSVLGMGSGLCKSARFGI